MTDDLKNMGEIRKNGFFRPEIAFPAAAFAIGILIRILMILPLGREIDALYEWAAQTTIVNHPLINFEHIYYQFKMSSCPLFYYYISYGVFEAFRLVRVVLEHFHFSDATLMLARNIIVQSPMIFADFGTSVIIYKIIKKYSMDYKKALIGGMLYFIAPPVLISGIYRFQTLSVTLFFTLLAVWFIEKKLHGAVLAGVFFSLAALSFYNPVIILPFIAFIVIRSFKIRDLKGGAAAIFAFSIVFLIITGTGSDFFLRPPAPPNLPSGESSQNVMTPVEGENASFYPLGIVYKNASGASYNINPAFNLWKSGFPADSDKAGYIIFFVFLAAGIAALSLRKKIGMYESALFFSFFFFILFLFPARTKDYLLLGVFPFLTILFFCDYRARLLWYSLISTFSLNLYYNDHFNIDPSAVSTVPAQVHLISIINLAVFAGFLYYFFSGRNEDSPEEAGNRFKEKIYEKIPTLKVCGEWLLVRENQQIVILLAVSFLIRLWRIGIPDGLNFDEKYYVPMARDYLQGITDPVTGASHPPLAAYLISIGTGIFGDNAFGWRVMSLLFSIALIALIYYFTLALFKKHVPAMFAASLLSLDFLHFVHSRLGMLDMYSTFFNVLSYFLFYLYIDRGKKKYLWGLAAALGLGLACKWTALFVIAGIGSVYLIIKISGFILKEKLTFGAPLRNTGFLKMAAVLLLIPIVCQFIAFAPLYHGDVTKTYGKIVELTAYHKGLVGQDEISSPWWSWIFIINPIQYSRGEMGPRKFIKEGPFFVVKLQEIDASDRFAVTGMGNPLVWWLSIPAFIAIIIFAFKKRDFNALYAAVPFIFQYFPWAFAKRITYLFYMIDIIPYMCIILAYCLYQIYLSGRKGRIAVFGYFGLVGLSFAAFYPLLSALNLPAKIYKMYKIFNFWQFK